MSVANRCGAFREEDESKRNRNTTANQTTPSTTCCSGSGRGGDVSLSAKGGSMLFGKGVVWADVSEDDDYDEDDSFWDKTAGAGAGKGKDGGDSSEEEEEEEEEEDWSSGSSDSKEQSSDRRIRIESSKDEQQQQQITKCLSKKEQKKLELEDLGAALAELGIAVPEETESAAENVTAPICAAIQSGAEGMSRTGKKKRKAKKNTPGNKNATDGEDAGVGEDGADGKATTPYATVSESVDSSVGGSAAISRDEAVNLLKNRQTRQPKKQSGAVHATVLAEAKKRSDKKPRLKKSEKLTQYQK